MAPQGFSAQKEAPGRGLNPPAGGSFFSCPSRSARPVSAPGSTKTVLTVLRRLGCWLRALFYDAHLDLKVMS